MSVYSWVCKQRKSNMGSMKVMVSHLMWSIERSELWMRWQCPGIKGDRNLDSQTEVINADRSPCIFPCDLHPGYNKQFSKRCHVWQGVKAQEKH